MEAQVLQQDDLAVLGVLSRATLLRLGSNAVRQEGDFLAVQQRLELSGDGFERVFVDDVAVWSTEMRHEDDGCSSLIERVLDGRNGGGDTLQVATKGVGR